MNVNFNHQFAVRTLIGLEQFCSSVSKRQDQNSDDSTAPRLLIPRTCIEAVEIVYFFISIALATCVLLPCRSFNVYNIIQIFIPFVLETI